MTDERRYREDEVKEILDLAASAPGSGGPALSSGEGLTLAELKEIGLEVGLDPERIGEAASTLDVRRSAPPRRTYLGMPVSVGRIVELPRAPTDDEWGLLVAELRATFGARGKLTAQGSLREWTNSNLHACVEPTETGYRLRLGTLKGNAAAINAVGIGGIAMAVLGIAILAVTGRLAEELSGPLIFAIMGAAALAYNTLTLPHWAREREEQMEYIAGRARALIGPKEDGDDTAC